MKKEKIEFRKIEECICEGKPCSCDILIKEIEKEKIGLK
jgi:hypothetical protein